MKQIVFFLLLSMLTLTCTSCKKEKKVEKWQDTAVKGIIPIVCDECFEPIIRAEIDVFESTHRLATILPLYTDEVKAIDLLLKDSVRMAVVTRGLTEAEQAVVAQRQMQVRKHKIATDAVALIINANNPDSIMGVPTLKKILTGEITEWKQINPKSKLGKIDVMFDNKNSSTVRYAIDSICRDKPLSTQLYAQKTNLEVVNMVAESPNSLGIVGVNWVSDDTDTTYVGFQNKIRVMAVSKYENATLNDSYQPYQGNIAMGDYPMTRDVYILLSDPRNGLSSGFTNFILKHIGQKVIQKSGLLQATQPIRLVNIKDEYPK